ncbi:MAG: DUF131 domain-containing protein [Candidatus Thorarchaeota archaeon]
MQSTSLMVALGWLLVLGGILLIFLGLILAFGRSDEDSTQIRTESKGIIFLGPIPIVWGFGRRAWMISIIGIIAIILYIIFFVMP